MVHASSQMWRLGSRIDKTLGVYFRIRFNTHTIVGCGIPHRTKVQKDLVFGLAYSTFKNVTEEMKEKNCQTCDLTPQTFPLVPYYFKLSMIKSDNFAGVNKQQTSNASHERTIVSYKPHDSHKFLCRSSLSES